MAYKTTLHKVQIDWRDENAFYIASYEVSRDLTITIPSDLNMFGSARTQYLEEAQVYRGTLRLRCQHRHSLMTISPIVSQPDSNEDAMNTLEQQLAFILELDRLKAVYRQTTVKADNNRQENSAEHSWHIALMAQILKDYVEEKVNTNRAVMMLLIHDIVEIDAGDTFAFAEQHELDGQENKEIEAANRLFGLLPEPQFQQMKTLWMEFEQAETADARFAKGMDRILPLLQNMANGGGSWVRHKVKKQQVLKRNEYLKDVTPALWHYACGQIDLAVDNGWLIDA